MKERATTDRVVARLVRALGPAAWAIILVGGASTFVLPGEQDDLPIRTALVATLAACFLVLVVRLLLVAWRRPERRLSLVFLAAGVSLWAVGSATISASQTEAAVAFPAPGEILCLASYLGMAAFLLLDAPRRRTSPALAVWLEAVVVCGAAVCLASLAVLTPLAGTFARGGLPLMVAIVFPLVDVLLGTLVIGQMMLRQRSRSLRTAGLAAGFFGLAIADGNFVVVVSDAYSTSLALAALWGLSFAVIVAAACVQPRPLGPSRRERESSGVLLSAGALAVVVLVLHPGGVLGWYITAPAILTLAGAGARLLLALRDAEGAGEAMRLSLTDELTGLPNRRALMAATDEALRDDAPLGFILLDLDGFKDINDSLGHVVGDEVLVEIAERMQAVISPSVMVARLGGDEFALLARGVGEVGMFEIAQKVRAVLHATMRVDSIDMAIDASVGITVREAGDTSSTELMRRADIAMYEAKQSRVGVLLFDASHDGFSRQRLLRGEDLRQAMAAKELVVWYQPQIDARTHEVVAMEALVRWLHPTDGMLAPITFLPDARRSGLMPALTEEVARQVFADARRWVDAGFTFRVAMNCAPPELVGGQLLPKFFEALDRAGLPPDSLLIEVTEDSFLSDPERARDAIYELRSHHVQVSIDDYGTGFSSLAYLRDLPVQELKIDRSFVTTVVTDERSRLIVQTTTQMAHALGLRLVAEGVEDAAASAALVPLGVDVLQGYHIARPMPAEDVAQWVQQWSERDGAGVYTPAAGALTRKSSNAGTATPSSPTPSVTSR